MEVYRKRASYTDTVFTLFPSIFHPVLHELLRTEDELLTLLEVIDMGISLRGKYQEAFRVESQPCCLLGNINASRGRILSQIVHGGTSHHREDSCRALRA
ncbi:hypothetical protein IG631_23740 [Alternaria alternata]|nr:hypothetical protein IG631_23740 [Alternaria alternata]